jgi:uncharacterized protein
MKQRILEDTKTAMRARDSMRLTTLRMLTSAMKQVEIDKQITLDDAAMLAVVQKMIKQRQDAAKQFAAADRQELADKELAEIEILNAYMPAQLADSELSQLIDSTITELNCSGMQDMGRALGVLKGKIAGRADMGKVSAMVKAKLAG